MLKLLHQYIGDEINLNGKQCHLIDVLDNESALVFACQHEDKNIQSNQHGDAHRKVHSTYTLSCLNDNGDDLHPQIKSFLPDHIHHQLREFLLSS